jgi:hypothetical protein
MKWSGYAFLGFKRSAKEEGEGWARQLPLVLWSREALFSR